VVKGAPYSAVATTEINQTLGDGNKIHRISCGAVYRDSEGRIRNEAVSPGFSPLAADVSKNLVLITDPVAGFSYMLDTVNKTAVKMALPPAHGAGAGPGPGNGPGSGDQMARGRRKGPGPGPGPGAGPEGMDSMMGPGHMHPAEAKRESLGSKTLEGIQADGNRSTMTIPAGQMGNERAIQVTSERWFSQHLQVPVLIKTTDPRMGDHTYSLTKIVTAEPDHSLFEIPAGYSVTEGRAPGGPGAGMRGMQHKGGHAN
jgi:hypothetical protein